MSNLLINDSINNISNINDDKKRDSIVQIDEYYFHKIQFALVYLISFFICIISSMYYYTLNDCNNKIILPKKNIEVKDYPFYKVISKHTHGNEINIGLELNFTYKNDDILASNLNVIFLFSLNRVNIRIFSTLTQQNIDEAIYEKNDAKFSDKTIDNYKDSNIGVIIYDSPFNFKLFRKDESGSHEVLFDSKCQRNQNLLLYSKNYMQLCANFLKDSYYFGFGEQKNHDNDLLMTKDQKYLFFSNISDSFPFYLSYNPNTMNSYGVLLFNSGPLQINVDNGQMSFEMINGYINFFVFGGPNTKEVIMQLQNTISLPILPYFNALDWYFFRENIKINNHIVINKEDNLTTQTVENYFSDDELKELKSNETSIFLSPTISSPELNDISFINYMFIHKSSLLIHNHFLLNYLNIVGLLEGRYYYFKSGESRPMILSTKSFVSSSAYLAKWLKDVPFTYEGMKYIIKKNIQQSLFGNPYTITTFDKGTLESNINNEKLVSRWTQLLSLFPVLYVDEAIPIQTNILKLRYQLSLYIYSYYIICAVEGGTYVRPIFFDFKPQKFIKEFLSNSEQLMLGSNLMIVPITSHNVTKVRCLLPEEKFYDYFTGEVVNTNGEGYYDITVKDDHIPILMRGGKITPTQLYEDPEKESLGTTYTLSMLKESSIQILICLDSNFQASGRIIIDDFESKETRNKKNYYKMLISVTQRSSEISIFFKVYSFKYKLPSEMFKNSIDRITVYGFSKFSVKKLSIMNKNGRVELDKSSFSFIQSDDVLVIQNISIPLNIDTKVFLYPKNIF